MLRAIAIAIYHMIGDNLYDLDADRVALSLRTRWVKDVPRSHCILVYRPPIISPFSAPVINIKLNGRRYAFLAHDVFTMAYAIQYSLTRSFAEGRSLVKYAPPNEQC
jgi:hypothetical protein